jgi:hypothetical protein
MRQSEFTFQPSTEKQQPQYFIYSYSNPLLAILCDIRSTPETTALYTMDSVGSVEHLFGIIIKKGHGLIKNIIPVVSWSD